MKNVLSYYYNMTPSRFKRVGNNYHFKYEYNNYILYYFDSDINLEEIYNLSVMLIQNNVLVHQIIINKDNMLVTIVDNKKYVLLKPYKDNYLININDIYLFSNFVIGYDKVNWYKLWCDKIDYIEYQVNEFKTKYPLLKESVDYFIGLTENAIMLLNDTKVNLVVSHKRVSKNSYDFYNPLNLSIDTRSRDIAEYYKNNMNINELKSSMMYLNSYEMLLVFIRVLYPSHYFDTYEDIINGIKKEIEIKNVINSIPKYEFFIKEVYLFITNYININIEWIKKI